VLDLARLLWGTVIHRPYVYAFFACFLVFAVHQLGWRRTATFTVTTFLVAFGAEYSSTRNGFPFGPYRYFDETRARELWISNVPFWDSLSFVFLSYFSLALAAALLSPAAARVRGRLPGLLHPAAPLVGGALMVLLDVVIDPVALQGDRWFLGRVYDYPYRGFYFGVTAANFAGWFIVGAASQWIFQRCAAHLPWCRAPFRDLHPRFAWGAYAVYAGVFGFNLAVTLYIGDRALAAASAVVIAATLGAAAARLRGRPPGRGAALVCAATRTEAGACRRGLRALGARVEVLRTGVGPERAARALRARLAAGPPPALVVSSGFAGALTPDLPARTIVTARALWRLADGRPVAVSMAPGALRAAPGAIPVEIVTTGHVVTAGAPRVPAPAAVDMESAALAEVAAEAGAPFAVLRLVTDTPAARLPPLAARIAAAASAHGAARGPHALAAAWLALRAPAGALRFARTALGWTRALADAWSARADWLAGLIPGSGSDPARLTLRQAQGERGAHAASPTPLPGRRRW
jgi:putative membrane protein